MLIHRLRTVIAYLTGAVFCLWALLWCRKFRVRGALRCYGWPLLQVADGTLEIGKNVHLGRVKIIIAHRGSIMIGDSVGINDGTVLGALSMIRIGSNSSIAENVMIRDHDHDYSNIPIGHSSPSYITRNVDVGRGCWLGYGSIVLKGVTVHEGAIVGAGAVVTRDVRRGCVVGGNPAKPIRTRGE